MNVRAYWGWFRTWWWVRLDDTDRFGIATAAFAIIGAVIVMTVNDVPFWPQSVEAAGVCGPEGFVELGKDDDGDTGDAV